jgi:outer membrane protein insertion porin family
MLKRHKAMALAVCTCVGMAALATVAAAQEQLIAEVTVEGNDYVAREAILDAVKDVLKVGEAYTEQSATAARRLVMGMEYFDDVTTSTEPMEKGVRVVITVVEKRRIERVVFAGNTVVLDTELRGIILTQPGHVVDMRAIRRDVDRIQQHYEKNGYIAHVSEAGVDDFGVLTFVIDEARLEDVVIEGLVHTKAIVVRRELDLEIGELFQQDRVAASIRKVYQTQLFENVETDIRPGKVDPYKGVILVVKVTEAKTGKAGLALAYSSLEDFVVIVSVADTNLRGMGERGSLSAEMGGRRSYELSFTEPYLAADGTNLEVNAFDTERRRRFVGGAAVTTAEDEFDERRTGGNFTLTKPLGPRRALSLRFRSEEISSSFLQGTAVLPPTAGTLAAVPHAVMSPGQGAGASPAPDNPDLDPDVPGPGETVGPIVVAAPLHSGGRLASLTLGVSDDKRNMRTDPTRGWYSGISYEQASDFLGGEEEFGKLMFDHRRYVPLGNDEKRVVALRVMGGMTLGDPPLFESFTVGGANTLRGYDADRWRGERLLLLNAEYRHGITDQLTAVAFVDVGDAFGGDFRTVVPGFAISAEDREFQAHTGVGAGLRVKTPFGPIRLDMGYGEEGSQAHFSFGHTF